MKKKLVLMGIVLGLVCTVLVGKAIAKAVHVMSSPNLNGMRIVIDAGHGGKDPGARVKAIDEDEINLKTAKKLKALLEAAGAEVIMIREDDVDLASENAKSVKREDLKRRVEIMNQPGNTLFISIHGNISLDSRVKGAEVYYQNDKESSHQLAATILSRLKVVTHSKFLPKRGDIYILNNTDTIGVLVEIGFLSNPEDLAKMQKDEYLNEVAYGIYQGIDDFVKILE